MTDIEELQKQILAINEELGVEINLWLEECKCTPNDAIIFDVYLMNQYLTSAIAFLVEKGIIIDEEFTLYYKQRQLEHMREERPKVRDMQLQALHQQLAVPRMDIPRSHKH